MSSPQDNRVSASEPPEHIEVRGAENMIRLCDHMGRDGADGRHAGPDGTAALHRPDGADDRDDVVTLFIPRETPVGEGQPPTRIGGMAGAGTADAAGEATELQVTGFSLPQVLLLSVAMSVVLIAAVVALASALFIFGGMA